MYPFAFPLLLIDPLVFPLGFASPFIDPFTLPFVFIDPLLFLRVVKVISPLFLFSANGEVLIGGKDDGRIERNKNTRITLTGMHIQALITAM